MVDSEMLEAMRQIVQSEIADGLKPVKEDIEVLKAGQARLEGDVAILKDGQARLEGDVAVLKDGQARLEGDVAVLKDGQARLEGDVAVLKDGQARLEGDVAILKKDVKSIKRRVEYVATVVEGGLKIQDKIEERVKVLEHAI